jgi:uncharacterized SAM-binding protein YcdF (DUF218 family)
VTYIEPLLPLLLVVGLAGLIRARTISTRWSKLAPMAISFAGIFLLSWQPAAWLFSQTLQVWYEQVPMPREDAPAIVVLSASVEPPSPLRPYSVVGHDTYIRLKHAAWLYKYWSARPVLACGGKAAAAMGEVLESEGIPKDRIWLEERSTSTHENAVNCQKILQQHGIIRIALVINANGMLRAAASFRKVGLDVVPAPCCFNHPVTGWGLLPSWQGMELNAETTHELVGMAWYWLRGWI